MNVPFAARCGLLFAATMIAAPVARAELLPDLKAIHLEAIGGSERVTALRALRARGVTTTNESELQFTLLAARPNRIRLQTESGGRKLVQGFDGTKPAWEEAIGPDGVRRRVMADAVARMFVADAEFDDPLVAGPERGFVLDYLGEVEEGDKRRHRILVTRARGETFTLLLDPATYLIVARVESRISAVGRKLEVVTEFSDFRPVAGVLLAHEVSVSMDGRRLRRTRIERMEPNPDLEPDVFASKGGNSPDLEQE